MLADDAVRDGQPEPGPLTYTLGREEGVEDSLANGCRHTGAVVAHAAEHTTVLASSGQEDLAGPLQRGDSVLGVVDHVQNDLFHLVEVEARLGQLVVELQHRLDLR